MAGARVIAIVGGTASGKSTLARNLARLAGADAAVCLPLDSYYRCSGHLSPEERDRQNMDHPDTLDHELYARHLQALRRGEEVNVPVYDFKTHTRSKRVERVSPKPFIIAEGIVVLHYPKVRALCDYSIFLDVADSERLARRITRDVRERGRTEASVLDQWNANVQPMHERYCAPTKEYASETITETLDDAGIQALWLRIAR